MQSLSAPSNSFTNSVKQGLNIYIVVQMFYEHIKKISRKVFSEVVKDLTEPSCTLLVF